jgi:thymidylate synthase (FAD)
MIKRVHEHGHIVLEAYMGGDLAIVNNARVSFDQESLELGEAEDGLIGFLMRNKHGSPFEAPVFRFDVKAPLFVFREWQRHRISSFNEVSARYSVIEDEFYVPERDYIRTQVGKPGAYTFERVEDDEEADLITRLISTTSNLSFGTYNRLIEDGVAKEIARLVLPVNMYSRMKWTVNLRSLLNFLALRNSEHAQREIRDYAIEIEKMVTEVVPVTMRHFNDNGRIVP